MSERQSSPSPRLGIPPQRLTQSERQIGSPRQFVDPRLIHSVIEHRDIETQSQGSYPSVDLFEPVPGASDHNVETDKLCNKQELKYIPINYGNKI